METENKANIQPQTEPSVQIINLTKKQIDVINKNFKNFDLKLNNLEKNNNSFCLCYSIFNLILSIITIVFNLFLLCFLLWILYVMLYSRLRYINYAPSKNLSWRCYYQELNIPTMSNPYFNQECNFNYIQCEKYNYTIYKNIQNTYSSDNYTKLVNYALLDQYNCNTYKSNIYINNYLNNFLMLKTYTSYLNNSFYYNMDLHCKYNDINLYNTSYTFYHGIDRILKNYDKYYSSIINEFSKNCTSKLKYYFLK